MINEYNQIPEGDKKKLKKASSFLDDKDFALHSEVMEINEHLEGIHENLKTIAEKEHPEMPEVHKVEVELKGISMMTIKGDKGDKGDMPSKEELTEIILPLIPEPIEGKQGPKGERGEIGPAGSDGADGRNGESIVGPKGEDGKDGSPDTGEQIIEKINKADGKIERERIEGLEDEIKQLRKELASKSSGGGVSALAVARMFKYIFKAETPSGTINGSNVTFTVQNNIWAILSIELNGEVYPSTGYSFINHTITFSVAPPAVFSGKDFICKYIAS